MPIFQDVAVVWNDEEKIVPANKILGLIAEVEEYVTIGDLASSRPKTAKISMAYYAALCYAGFKGVQPDEVYASLIENKGKATEIVTGLIYMMLPPDHLRKAEEAIKKEVGEPEKKPTARKRKKSAKAAS